jgi:DNA-binding transcriptional regulator of glucitol operon
VRVLFRPGWLIRHAAVVILVLSFLALGWWQVTRAVAGNLLSYAYAVEWPVFAGFTIFVWVKEMRRALADDAGAAGEAPITDEAQPRPRRAATARARAGAAYDDSDDPDLAAYNRYLGWLAANPDRTPADYPG